MTPNRGKNREHAFQDCLDQLQREGRSLDSALEQYPQYSPSIKPDLETARWLHARSLELQPRPGFVSASRRRLLARLETGDLATPTSKLRWSFASLRYPSTWRNYAPRLALVYLLLFTLLLNAGRISADSINWLPGDVVYPLKIALEEIAIFATPTAAGDARLHIQFAHRRSMEVQALVLESRFEQIPATVTNFGRHVNGAVRSVDRLARQDRDQAHRLALDLQRVLSKQTPMVLLFLDFTPEAARADFQLVLSISEDGVSAMQKVLHPEDSGAAEVLGAGPSSASEVAYRIVR